MVPKLPSYKLDRASRLNYAKVYTIEYNVKVKFIGKIHPDSSPKVVANYNELHPPISQFRNSNYNGGSNSGYGGSQSGGGYGGGSGSGYGGASSFSTVDDSNSPYNTSTRSAQTSSYTQQPRTTGYSVPYNTSTTQGGFQASTYSGYTLTNTSSMYPGAPEPNPDPEETQQTHDDAPSSFHTTSYDHHEDIYDDDY
jgi:hypothetical protein